MKILALDLSSHAGWALLEGERGAKPRLVEYGNLTSENDAPYPWGTLNCAELIGRDAANLAIEHHPDIIVVEETNLGKQRYSQKMLEFIHCCFLRELREGGRVTYGIQVVYLSSSEWRKVVGLRLSTEQRAGNRKLSRAKSKSRTDDGVLDLKNLNAEKKKLGIRGKVTWKHLAVDRVNADFGLQFQMKDNDIADAILVGCAYFAGARPCDGTGNH